jgi:transcriptional regulator with XRE-family HTH domain
MPTRTDDDKKESKRIGARIKSLRVALRIRQQDLAESLGVSYQQVQKYENGTDNLTIAGLKRVAKALDVSSCELLGCYYK